MKSKLLQTSLLLVPTFIAGMVASAWWLSSQSSAVQEVRGVSDFDQLADSDRLENMIDSLAEIVNFEVAERRRLETELNRLTREIENLTGSTADDAADNSPRVASLSPAGRQANFNRVELTEERLVEAGFAADVATRLKRQNDEIAMQRLYLRDQAMREGWLGSSRYREELQALNEQQNQVRADLSPDEYDRYLWALGRPNRVTVSSVLSGSPAEQAGLQAGDQIISYAGERIFSPREIRRRSGAGTAGESIAVEVLRNGEPQLVYVPRGPLGVQMAAAITRPGN